MIKNDCKPRVIFIFLFFVFLFLIILIRLFLVQIFRKDFFKNLATLQYDIELVIPQKRAKIYDRNHRPLVVNKEAFSAFILPKEFENKKIIMNFLYNNFYKSYEIVKKDKNKKFVWLERHLTTDRVSWLKNFNFNEINFINEFERFYPYSYLSTVLGFTDVDNIGISGVELEFNKVLGGESSVVNLKKDASGNFYFEKEIKHEGKKGENIVLTIDSDLQFFAYEELKELMSKMEAVSGSVLIMNPDNGEVLAMVNYPDFDPNNKKNNDLELTKNKIITECYELGSVMKTFAALAALEENVVTPDELIDCEGKVAYFDRFRVENWTKVDIVPFKDVIKNSSNIGIAKVAQRLGTKLYDHLVKIGFGKKTGIEFPGERAGFVNPPKNWSKPSILVMSYGYEISASLLQIGKGFSVIANGGYDVRPILIKNNQENKQENKKKLGKKLYSDKAIKDLKDILQTIGEKYNKGIESFRVMGKTGTARSIKDGIYSKKDHVYTFGGIIEKDDYKRVIVTFLKEPKGAYWWAAQLTAPLFNRIAEKMVLYEIFLNSSNICSGVLPVMSNFSIVKPAAI